MNTPSVDDLNGSRVGENSPSWKNRLHEFYEVLWSSAVRSLFANNKENTSVRGNSLAGSKSCSKLDSKQMIPERQSILPQISKKPSSVTFKCLEKYEVLSSEEDESLGLKKKFITSASQNFSISAKSKDIKKAPTPGKNLNWSSKKSNNPTPAFKIQSSSASIANLNNNRSALNETPFRDKLFLAGKTPISLKTPAKVIYQACQKLTSQNTCNIKPISSVPFKK